MKVMLGFLPFIAFAIASATGHSEVGLLAGGVIAAGFVIRDWLTPRLRLKLLDIGTFVLFGVLAVFVWTSGISLSVAVVRVCVDGGLLLVVLTTIVIGKPFTMGYAKQQVDPSLWHTASFVRTNQVISMAWAGAFAVMIVADIALWRGVIPARAVGFLIAGAVYAAIRFTQWYPHRRQNQPAMR